MAPIVDTVEINRSAEDVFAYLDALERHGEWQQGIVRTKDVTPGPVRVGTRATDIRRMGPIKGTVTYEVVEYDPPRRTAFKGVNGAVRVVGSVTVESLDAGRSRLTLELDFEGRGIGKLFAPMARKQAAREVPQDQQQLKERLEAGA
jgi:uncharacterized protein YndB with AHSA1/START domain